MPENRSTDDNTLDYLELPLDSPDRRRLPPLLRRAWYRLNQAFRRRISKLGITPDQFTVLRTLVENDCGITQKEICNLMSSDPNTVAAILHRMDEAGLVERRPHAKDRRALSNSISSLGKSKFEAARNIAIELQQEILQSLPENRRETFLRDLEIVADACLKTLESAGD